MSDEVIMLRVSEAGRITIPANHRKAVGLEAGGVVVARVINGEIRIRPVRDVLAEFEAKVHKHAANSGTNADRLPADRQQEAALEAC